MRVTDDGLTSLSSGDSVTWSTDDDVEVHTEDTDGWIVLDTQVDVFLNTETEVTGGREVSVSQLVFLDLQTSLQDLFSLWTSDGDVDGNLFVSSDTEGSNGVSSLGVDWSLTRQLFQDLGSSGQSVTRFTDRDVKDQLLDLQFTHSILSFVRHLWLYGGDDSWNELKNHY